MDAVASILTIGDELTSGARIDTNGPWISNILQSIGVKTLLRQVVVDQVESIADAIQLLSTKTDLLILTGGLGPTADDRTRQALGVALGEALVSDAASMQSIRDWFEQRNIQMPTPNEVQALRPESADWLKNEHGTAPGLKATLNGCQIFCLPGPPTEMKPMFQSQIDDIKSSLQCGKQIKTIELHSWGLAESVAGEAIKSLLDKGAPAVSVLMSSTGITARVSSSDDHLLTKSVNEIKTCWTPWMYGQDESTLATCIAELLAEQGLSMAIAESCTGGLMSDALVQVEGSSAWYQGGFITYSNAMKKSHLKIDSKLLEEAGAVSCQVAAAMSEAICKQCGAEVGLSATGIAGPTGGTIEKPVGTVFLGCTINGVTTVRKFCFSGTRNQIRSRASNSALQMLRLRLLGVSPQLMCWQQGEVVNC